MSPVDHDLLADYAGGALDGTPQKDRVEQLIATSPEWRRAADELTTALQAVSHDLSSLRDVAEIMPPDVVARFDELLASQAMAPAVARPRAPLVSRAARRRRRWRTWAAPLAIAAASLAFFAVGRLSQLPASQQDATSEGFVQSQGEAPAAVPSAASVPTITTWQQYDRRSLQGKSRMTADSPPPQTFTSDELDTASTDGLRRFDDQAAMKACLSAVAVVLPGKVTAVEYAYFEGKPALVISITSFNGNWKFVAGPNCGVTGADELYRTQL